MPVRSKAGAVRKQVADNQCRAELGAGGMPTLPGKNGLPSPTIYRDADRPPPSRVGRRAVDVPERPPMRHGSSRIAILLVVFTLTLVAAPAVAAGGRVHHPAESSPGLFATAWQAPGELVSWLGGDQAGSGLGFSGLAASACPGERGSIMDPNGCPQSQGSPDSGSIMDPDG